jgi:glycosyltransferase involved in cell wall biosynthesis
MIVYSNRGINTNSRETIVALAEAGILAEYWTSIHWRPESIAARLMPPSLARQFERRTFPQIAQDRVRSCPWRELGRLFSIKYGLKWLTRHEAGFFAVDRVTQSLDARVARELPKIANLTAVFSEEDGACSTFEAAKKLALPCIYSQLSGYWRARKQIFDEEREAEPEWAITISGANDSAEKLARKDKEVKLADHIIVASTFTQRTLDLAPVLTAKIHKIPYGAPPVGPEPNEKQNGQRKLKLLYVGQLTQAKGLSYMFDAVERMKDHVELTVVGRPTPAKCDALNRAMAQHRWIESLPHSSVLDEMRAHDVFLFPSLSEGFGLVILEAMSQGTPVIATVNTAAPEVITHGVDGFVVPIRSSDAIVEALERLLVEPGLLRSMRMAAWETAGRRTWAQFRQGIQDLCQSACS